MISTVTDARSSGRSNVAGLDIYTLDLLLFRSVEKVISFLEFRANDRVLAAARRKKERAC